MPQTGTLFGKTLFADVMKGTCEESAPHCPSGLRIQQTEPPEEKKGRQHHTKEEAETRVRQLQATTGVPSQEASCAQAFRGSVARPTPSFWTPGLQIGERTQFGGFKPASSSNLDNTHSSLQYLLNANKVVCCCLVTCVTKIKSLTHHVKQKHQSMCTDERNSTENHLGPAYSRRTQQFPPGMGRTIVGRGGSQKISVLLSNVHTVKKKKKSGLI